MNTILLALLIFVAVGVGLWLVSLVMEALRQKPRPPATLRWSPDIPIQTIDIGGAKLRYIKSGKGPVLVLLHTENAARSVRKGRAGAFQALHRLCARLSRARLFGHSAGSLRCGFLHQSGRRLP